MRALKMDPLKRREGDTSKYMNPYKYDIERMGVDVGKNVTIMYMSHEHNERIVVVNNKTGERLIIEMDEEDSNVISVD
jgi:hypothetical protein